jgi:hypothetical protein
MPYIKREDRTADLARAIDNLAYQIEQQDKHYMVMEKTAWEDMVMKAAREINPGTLNFAISRLIHRLVMNKGVCYSRLSLIRGVLQDVNDEFYRTVVAAYEDKKRKENGGVSDLDKVTLEDVR